MLLKLYQHSNIYIIIILYTESKFIKIKKKILYKKYNFYVKKKNNKIYIYIYIIN